MDKIIFKDIMDLGVTLSKSIQLQECEKYYPDYLRIRQVKNLCLEDKLDPSDLPVECALIYKTNLYITDAYKNIAYFDCDVQHTDDAGKIRKKHQEYKSVGGKRVSHSNMDAGHFGISLGQHPSIAMEQHRYTNRYGIWRKYERYWDKLSQEGHKVNVKAVFVDDGEDGSTYSSFWCIRECIDDEKINEFVITNDDLQ